MGNKYFIHEIRIGKEGKESKTFKGIVICNDFDAAKQGYHAFLGAYAYGNDADIAAVQAMITDLNGAVYFPETWLADSED